MRCLLPAVLVAATLVGSLGGTSLSAPWAAATTSAAQQATDLTTADEAPVGPLGSLPPRPAVIEVAPDAVEGQLAVDPPIVWLETEPGRSTQPHLTVTNGGASAVSLDVEVVPLAAGAGGAPVPVGTPVAIGEVPVDGVTPEDATRDGASAGGATPDGAASQVATRDGATADGATSAGADEAGPEGGAPDGASADGATPEMAARDGAAPSAARWVLLAERSLHLGAGEQAHVWPSVGVPPDASHDTAAAAIRFRAEDGPEVAAVVAVDPGGAPAEVAASVELFRTGTAEAGARITLRSAELASVVGRLRVRSWWGSVVIDLEVPPTLVLPEVPRVQEVAFRAPVVPGPYRLEAELTPRDGAAVTASDRTFLWSPAATAAIVLVVVVVVVLVIRRHRTA